MILDAKTAISGVSQGIELCIKSIIPALFPFMLVASFCSAFLRELPLHILELILAPCRLPKGAASIFMIGMLGGYPIGAKLTHDAYINGSLSKADAQRMLMFCSNAGPSFIFGVLGSIFSEKWIPWFIWSVNILSAYLVGLITAVPPTTNHTKLLAVDFSITKSVFEALKSLLNICGWVTVFRLLLAYLEKIFIYTQKPTIRVLVSGTLELSNGCLQIPLISDIRTKILVAILMITFGGFCVILQTASVAPKLSIQYYIKGKLYQTIFAFLIAFPILFSLDHVKINLFLGLYAPVFFIIIMLFRKNRKNSSFPKAFGV